ncbi:MAG TPA: TolC family protein, partial [Verrucomicrobiae bacterium]|nr:TolC family protein [Verrucomicrobiae bacterium]
MSRYFRRTVILFCITGFLRAETNIIDLPTVLRLAGAQSVDVQIARERLAEARANHEAALWQFFPWITPGAAYRAHDNAIQNVEGRIIDVNRDSYNLGGTILVQWDLGEAIYKRLASRQLAQAAEHGLEAQQQDIVLTAASGYFELARAEAVVGVNREAVRIAEDYAGQVDRAVEAGIAFKADAFRARTQLERNHLALRQASEQQRVAAARLAQVIRLDSGTPLASDGKLLPITLFSTNVKVSSL